jgi:hypothetical protein
MKDESRYSLDDLPKIVHQPAHTHSTPAAPSSTYTQSCLLGSSRSQDVLSAENQNSARSRLSVGHFSSPNMSLLYQQGSSQVYRHIPVSQPLLSRIPIDADGDSAVLQDHTTNTRHFSTSESPSLGQLPANFVSLSRKSTYKRQTFSLLPSKRNSSSITGIFVIDPHLRLPAGLLKLVDSSGDRHPARKNLVLEAENGGIDVDIHIAPSKPPTLSVPDSIIPQPRRSTDKYYLQPGSEPLRRPTVPDSAPLGPQIPTRLDLRLTGNCEKFQLIARIVRFALYAVLPNHSFFVLERAKL